MKKTGIDVTEEYLTRAQPGTGTILSEPLYDDSLHEEEIAMAKWLKRELGGDITLVKEAGQSYAVSKPDYIWHDHYWELKSLSSPKAVDSALRKAVRQIHDRPGGVILDFGKNTITISSIESAIRSRLEAVCKFSVDIIILNKGKLVKVLRYK